MAKQKKENVAIILAGGSGSRFASEGLPKQFVKIAGKTVLEYTIERFEDNKKIDEIIIVINPTYYNLCEEIVYKNNYKKVSKILNGGKDRIDSSRIGVMACDSETTKKVLTHDAIRPFVSDKIINDMIKALDKYVCVDSAIPLADTLIKVNEKNIITEIPKRADYRRGQTPQGFQYKTLIKAHELTQKDPAANFTDDCGMVIKYKLGDIYVVEGSEENLKITYPLDIHVADKLFQLKSLEMNDGPRVLEKLKNKNIVVFGHSSGIGAEIYNISKKYSSKVKGFSLSNGIDICDFKKVKESLSEYTKKYGSIDYLIVTAGILQRKKLSGFSNKEIEHQILCNYISQVNIVKEALNHLSKNSSIALFTSSSYTRGRATYSIYSSTKAAIVNLVQALSEELIEIGVKINAICPARTNTPMRKSNFGSEPKNSLLDPKEVAIATLKACVSDLTGQVIDIKLM